MKYSVAEMIAKKAKAVKHCDKLLKKIESKGFIEIPLSGTGVSLPVTKGDTIHTLIKSVRFKYSHDINSIEVINGLSESKRFAPAPVGASDEEPAVCQHCGVVFNKYHGRQKFCCDACRKEAYKAKK